jgi:hypothetical protein
VTRHHIEHPIDALIRTGSANADGVSHPEIDSLAVTV